MQRDPNPPKSTVERILEQQLQARQVDEQVIDNEREYKAALNALAKTKNGRIVLKYLLKACKIYSVSPGNDVIRITEERALKNLWVSMFHRYLDKTNRMEIE
mgnify:CR=1 FL=1